SDVRSWPSSVRATFAKKNFAPSSLTYNRGCTTNNSIGLQASPLRELHNAVFDSLTQPRPRRVLRVGNGSLIYEIIGNWVPPSTIAWMLGIRKTTLDDINEHEAIKWEEIEK